MTEGLVVDERRSANGDHIFLATSDPQLAYLYDMPDEGEFMDA